MKHTKKLLASAATISSASGALVQITQVNNYFDNSGYENLNLDFTADGRAEDLVRFNHSPNFFAFSNIPNSSNLTTLPNLLYTIANRTQNGESHGFFDGYGFHFL